MRDEVSGPDEVMEARSGRGRPRLWSYPPRPLRRHALTGAASCPERHRRLLDCRPGRTRRGVRSLRPFLGRGRHGRTWFGL